MRSVWHGCFRLSPSNCVCCSRRRGKSSCPSSSSPRPASRRRLSLDIGRSRCGRVPTLFDRRSAIVTLPSSSRTPSSLPLDPPDFPVERAPSDLDPDLTQTWTWPRTWPRSLARARLSRLARRAPVALARARRDRSPRNYSIIPPPNSASADFRASSRASSSASREPSRAMASTRPVRRDAMRCDAGARDAPRSIHDERRRTTTRRKSLRLLPSRPRARVAPPRAAARTSADRRRPVSRHRAAFSQLFGLDLWDTSTSRDPSRDPHGPRPRGRLVSATWRPAGGTRRVVIGDV